ncbi:MAG: hypothetical protein ABIT07_10240 [Ferruginibacter sp.]
MDKLIPWQCGLNLRQVFKVNLDVLAQSIICVRKTRRRFVELYFYARERRDGSGSPATAFCGRRL